MFDVDGVLVDTEGSYTVAVMKAVQWLVTHDAGLLDDGPVIDRDTVRVWRDAGGWNNDWDLTTGMSRWLLAGRDSRTVTTTQLRRAAGSARAAAARSLDELARIAEARAPRTWEEIRAIFDEFYNGSAVTAARYGVPARVGIARGLQEEESIMLHPETIEQLRAAGASKFGVVTGRSDDDWEQVAPRLPLPHGILISTDSHGKKPDPLPLKRVLDQLGAKGFVAIGDTVDDVRMVTAYLELKGSAKGVSVVRCQVAHEAPFRELGVTRFVRHVDELPRVVAEVRAGG